jgi:hypothetical protein
MKELYERHLQIRKQTEDIKREHINELLTEYPQLLDSVLTKIDTSFGEHMVYVIHVEKYEREFLKIGYTKNTVEKRYGEKRWSDKITLPDIKEKLREKRLPALGAVLLEKEIKKYITGFNIKTQLTGPGKGELYDIVCKDLLLDIYDDYYEVYKDTVGLKRAN